MKIAGTGITTRESDSFDRPRYSIDAIRSTFRTRMILDFEPLQTLSALVWTVLGPGLTEQTVDGRDDAASTHCRTNSSDMTIISEWLILSIGPRNVATHRGRTA